MTEEYPIALRRPMLADGKAVYDLIERCPPLDLNSSYCYFLLCSHFRETCVLAEDSGCLVGFISAYLTPGKSDTLFVWQMAVDKAARGRGLAGHMLDYLLAQPACATVRNIETTVSPSNSASRRVFARLAEKLQTDSNEDTFLEASHFGGEAHEEERLIRIGPWPARQNQQEHTL